MGNALEALTYDGSSVFRGIEQHGSSLPGRELPQARDTCGDRDGAIEGEEGFAALGLAADDANGLSHPQPFDEPGLLALLGLGEERGADGGKRLHGGGAQKELASGGLPDDGPPLSARCCWR
jgi:hypothetical protein